MLMVRLIWVAWVTKKTGNVNEDEYNGPVSAKGRDFYFNYTLTFNDWIMETVFQSWRFNEFI